MLRTMLLVWLAACSAWGISLERSMPEAEGVSSRAVLNFIDHAEAQIDALHSFMLVRHGKVIAEGWWAPYNAASPQMLYSLSKSFTATAIGMAVAEGRLSLHDRVVTFFPDETPPDASENLKSMRITDLLSMTTGHQDDTVGRITSSLTSQPGAAADARPQKTWVEKFLSLPVEHKPGTHFCYNSGASFMLSAVLQKVTGMTLFDYLTPRLFDPLGITDAAWESNPEGINLGGWGLSVTTEDIAKFGQLYLQKGVWQGKRLLDERWVEAATSRQTSNGSNPESDWEQGYGFQFWRCRHNAYRGDGAFGQYCIVMPEQDAVIAITGGVRDMQAVLNLVWSDLLPAMGDSALKPDPAAALLKKRSADLKLATPLGSYAAEAAKKISGKTFRFNENKPQGLRWVRLEMKKKNAVLTFENASGEQRLEIGYGEWLKGRTNLAYPNMQPVAAAGAWSAENRFDAALCYYHTPYILKLGFDFADNELTLDMEYNVAFGERRLPTLRAVRQ